MKTLTTADFATDETNDRRSASSGILAGYLDEPEFCRQLNITPRTARNWRQRGDGPPYVQIGRDIIYPIDGFRGWLKKREIDPSRRVRRGVGAGGGLSLQIIGKLLGHATARMTQRYAHLGDDALRRRDEVGLEAPPVNEPLDAPRHRVA